MRKQIAFIALAVLIGLNFAFASSANFPENFDTYNPNTISPGPWTFQTNNVTCYGSSSSRVLNTGNPASPPNDYYFSNLGNFAGDCTRGTYGRIISYFNASAQFIQVVAYVRLANGSTAPPLGDEKFFINSTSYLGHTGNLVYSTLYGNQTDVNGIGFTYKKFVSDISTFPAGNVSISFGFIFSPGASLPLSNPAAWEVDNVSINGANRIIPNYNFAMYNSSTYQWYSISSFQGSRVQLNFTGGGSNDSAQWSPNGVIIPDIKYSSLTSSNLVTVWVGNSYSRSLIPSTSGGTQMFLDSPSSVNSYAIHILAPPGFYPGNSRIWIASATHNVTSGYIDSAASFSTYLVPGPYTVTLKDAIHTTVQTVSFPATVSSVTIDAYNISSISPASSLSSVHWNVGWNSTITGIIVNYWDNTSTTTSLGVTIKEQNGTGTFQLFTHVYTVSTAFFQVTIAANSPSLNKNMSQYLYVYLVINSTYFGTKYPLSTTPLSLAPGIFQTPPPNLPSSVGGFNLVFPNGNWLWFVSGIILLFVGGGFGLFQSRIGFPILIFTAAFFSLAGWFVLPTLFLITMAAMAVLGLMSWYRRN